MGIELAGVPGSDLVETIAAWDRLVSFAEAGKARAIAELAAARTRSS